MTSIDANVDTSRWTNTTLLSTTARLWEYALNTRLATLELSTAGLTTLQALHESGTTSQASLARTIKVQPQTLRRTMATLEEKGYLIKSAPPPGPRGLDISITATGLEILLEANHLEQQLHQDLFDTHELRSFLITLIHNTDRVSDASTDSSDGPGRNAERASYR